MEGLLASLFSGKKVDYYCCINVDDVTTYEEEFYDLHLEVKGCEDLYASLDEYFQYKKETLQGDNQYLTQRFGKQDVKRGYALKSLPPVLTLCLDRIKYENGVEVHVRAQPSTSPAPKRRALIQHVARSTRAFRCGASAGVGRIRMS